MSFPDSSACGMHRIFVIFMDFFLFLFFGYCTDGLGFSQLASTPGEGPGALKHQIIGTLHAATYMRGRRLTFTAICYTKIVLVKVVVFQYPSAMLKHICLPICLQFL